MDKRERAFFNVIMKSNEADKTNLGLHVSRGADKGPIYISDVGKGSLSEACGLKAGDVVDMVNGTKVGAMSVQEVERLIDMNKDKINLQIRRDNDLKHKVISMESAEYETDATFTNLTKSVSTECNTKRKKVKEGICGSFMSHIFRSRSQDPCKNTNNSSTKSSTVRSSSMIVNLSSNGLSSPQNNLKKSRRLSSCMKIFKSKESKKDKPEIDMTVSPNNAYNPTATQQYNHSGTQAYNQSVPQTYNHSSNHTYKQSPIIASIQERSELTKITAADLPISLNVINSQASSSSSSSPHSIVNISPTLKILNITTPDETSVKKPLECYLINYTEPVVSESVETAPSRAEKPADSKSKLLLTQSRFDNKSSMNTNIKMQVSEKAIKDHKFKKAPVTTFIDTASVTTDNKVTPITTADNTIPIKTVDNKLSITTLNNTTVPITAVNTSLYTVSQKSEHKDSWTKSSKVIQTNTYSMAQETDISTKENIGDSKKKSTEMLEITSEIRPTTENLEKELEVASVSYQTDVEEVSKEPQFLESSIHNNESIRNREFVIVAPKRHIKNVVIPDNITHFTNTTAIRNYNTKNNRTINPTPLGHDSSKSTTPLGHDSSISTTPLGHDSSISTTTTLDLNNKKVTNINRLKLIKSAEEKEKVDLDKILDDALLELKAETSLSQPRPDLSNKQYTISTNQNSSETGCENMNYDVNKHDFHNTIYAPSSASVIDNVDKETYISTTEIMQTDQNKEINNNKSTTDLTFYSMNNGCSDVGQAIKSPDSGISSILSPSDLNERLEKSNSKSNDYEFVQSQGQSVNNSNNMHFISEERTTNYNNSVNEMNKKDKKLINVVSPTELNVTKTLENKHNSVYILKHQPENVVGTFDEFDEFNNRIVHSEIELNPCYSLSRDTHEVDSLKEQLNQKTTQKTSFVDAFGAPIVRPPSYNSVVYCGVTSEQPSSNNMSSHYHQQTPQNPEFSSQNSHIQDFRFENNPPLSQYDPEYDNLKNNQREHQHLKVSPNEDGIYEQIPAHKNYFASKKDNFHQNNTQYSNQATEQDVAFKSQSHHFQAHENRNNKNNNNNNKNNNSSNNNNIAKLDDYLREKQLHSDHQGYYFSDRTDKHIPQHEPVKKHYNSERETPIALQQNEVMDELKQAFIGNRGASEAFYSTNPSQSFTPINQKTPFQWSFNDISIQNLALDAPRKPVYAGYRENNVFEHELENEHRMENVEEIEKQRMYIKGIHQSRNRKHAINASEKLVNTQDTLYEDLEHPCRTRTTKYRGKATVIHNFRARKPVELSLRKGDIVFLLRKIDKNWLEGEHHNMTGIFPLSYVEILESLEDAQAMARMKEGSATVLYDFSPRSPLELALKKGYVVTLVRRIDDNWYEGRFGHKRGIFPASYVSPMREPDTPLATPCVSPLPTPQHSGWRSPSVASMFSVDFPSACPSELNVDFSRVSTPLGGSILEGYMPGGHTLPRSSSAMSAPVFMRTQPFNQPFNYPLNYANNTLHPMGLRQSLYRPMIKEEFEEFAPQKPSLRHGGTMSRMSRLQGNNQFTNVPLYNREVGSGYQHRQTNPYLTNTRTSESLDRRNTPLNYARSRHYEPRDERPFQNNKLISGSYTITRNVQGNEMKQDQRGLISQKTEREIDTAVTAIIYPRYRSLHNFEARKAEEISLRMGDVVRVVERCRDGWFIGFVESNRKFGLFPGTFVEAIK